MKITYNQEKSVTIGKMKITKVGEYLEFDDNEDPTVLIRMNETRFEFYKSENRCDVVGPLGIDFACDVVGYEALKELLAGE